MIKIRLKISSVNDTTYKQVVLRKFFNMVFFSADGKKLTIYTATVFGGMHEVSGSQEKGKLMPKYEKAGCILRFEYEIDNLRETGKEKLSIKFVNLTESFCKQTKYIEKVWGRCEKLESQTALKDKLDSLYPDAGLVGVGSVPNDLYYISEPEKTEAHKFVVTCGEFENKEDDKYGYRLKSEENPVDGIEYMNWVKSEIQLPESMFYKRFSFEIVFSDSEKVTYYTPDFTWYFAPPEGYKVDKETAELNVGNSKNSRNCVQSVADDTTVHFYEWERDESIDDCKKVRVDLKDYTSALEPQKLASQGKLALKMTITNPNRGANRQFLIGLLLAFLLAFCADKTRMNDFYSCLQENCGCGDECSCQRLSNLFSVTFPVIVLFTYLSLIFKLKLCVPVNKGRRYYVFYGIKSIGVAATFLLVVYTFVVWMVVDPEVLQSFVPTCNANWWIIFILAVVSIVLNIVYFMYCTKIRKKKILDNL
mgnify:CR=1 FL=1